MRLGAALRLAVAATLALGAEAVVAAASAPAGTVGWAVGSVTSASGRLLRIVEAGGARLSLASPSDPGCRLTSPGLGLNGPMVPCDSLAAGDTVAVEYVTRAGASPAQALRAWIEGPMYVTPYETGQFPVAGQFAAAPSMAVTPAGASFQAGDTAAVYTLSGFAFPDTAYALYLNGAWPAVTGTIGAGPPAQLQLEALGGSFDAALAASTRVSLAGAPVSADYLVRGATATVRWQPNPRYGGAPLAAEVALAPTRAEGVVRSVATLAPGTALASVAGANGGFALFLLPHTTVAGADRLRPGDVVTAQGVAASHGLYATTVEVLVAGAGATDALVGKVTALRGGDATVATGHGVATERIIAQTAFAVGTYAAGAPALAVGDTVRVVGVPAGAGRVRAIFVAIAPTIVRGVVTAVAHGGLTIARRGGGSLTLARFPGAAVTGGATTVSVDDPVVVTAGGPATSPVAYAVRVGVTPPPSPAGMVRGTILQVSGVRALLRLTDGQVVLTNVDTTGIGVAIGAWQEASAGMVDNPYAYVTAGSTGIFDLVTVAANATQLEFADYSPTVLKGTVVASRVVARQMVGFAIRLATGQRLPVGLRPGMVVDVFTLMETRGVQNPDTRTKVVCTGVLGASGLVADDVRATA